MAEGIEKLTEAELRAIILRMGREERLSVVGYR